MKGDGGDKVRMGKDIETGSTGDMPQTDGPIHAGGKEKVIFGPSQIHDVTFVALPFPHRLNPKDGLRGGGGGGGGARFLLHKAP